MVLKFTPQSCRWHQPRSSEPIKATASPKKPKRVSRLCWIARLETPAVRRQGDDAFPLPKKPSPEKMRSSIPETDVDSKNSQMKQCRIMYDMSSSDRNKSYTTDLCLLCDKTSSANRSLERLNCVCWSKNECHCILTNLSNLNSTFQNAIYLSWLTVLIDVTRRRSLVFLSCFDLLESSQLRIDGF